MNYSEQQLAILSAQESNILAITSVCNVRCLFCSHQGNPSDIRTFSSGHRSLEEIEEIIEFIDKDKKIVIGESITRICEGEPFTHPQIIDILRLLRKKFPETLIQITTNGSRLTEENLKLLESLQPIEINLSLNSSSLSGREKLMKDRRGEVVLEAIKRLKELDITYHGSIVAMPHITGWNDLEESIEYLDTYHAQTIRVFLPGYTKYSPESMKFDLNLWEDLREFINECRQKYQTPITLDPVKIESLAGVVVGVIKDSPAFEAGIKVGDIILEVDGEKVLSRVDAFNQITEKSNPKVLIDNDGISKLIEIKKSLNQKSGLVFDYDLSPSTLQEIERVISNYRADKTLLLTSKLAEARIRLGVELLQEKNPNLEIDILVVENRFFGGSILAAGLLVVDDFREALQEYRDGLAEIDLILLPKIAFNYWGLDLLDKNYYQLVEEFGVEVEII
jgi:NifB/MoaA-like Fe-S oxidoreductase